MNANEPVRLDRRAAIKWMLTATAGAALFDKRMLGGDTAPAAPGSGSHPDARPYGTDPDLLKNYRPGDLWPLTFSDAQRRTAAALCDVILPADDQSPGAAALGVQDFVDEWISAPYPDNVGDRPTILDGLAWIEAESQRRFGQPFAGAIYSQKTAICDDLCHEPDAKPEFKAAARFFKRFRSLAAGGYYTTPEGMREVGYIGNVPLAAYPEPPREVLEKLGLA